MRQPSYTRRDFVKVMSMGTLGLRLPVLARVPSPSPTSSKELFVYIGTYTHAKSEGIYGYRLDLGTGALVKGSLVAKTDHPSFLAIHPRRTHLYAVNESIEGERSGAVSAFAIDRTTGALTFLNRQSTHGGAPCHLTVDQTGKWVLVANYMGGNVAVFPVQADGQLGPASDVVQHEGKGVNLRRQDRPHAHSIILDAANRFVFVADLGIDRPVVIGLVEKCILKVAAVDGIYLAEFTGLNHLSELIYHRMMPVVEHDGVHGLAALGGGQQ